MTLNRRGAPRRRRDKHTSLLLRAAPNTPDDARSLVRENVRQLQSQLRNAMLGPISRETKAHYGECVALIEDSFKASLQKTTF